MSSKTNLMSISPVLADFRDKPFNNHAPLTMVSTQRSRYAFARHVRKTLTLQREPSRIWSVIEVNISCVKICGEGNPIPREKSRMTVDSTATEAMTDDEKYKAIIAMESIDPDTVGRYPTRAQFLEALAESRIAGDYVNRIVIVSTDPQQQYRFTKQK